MYSEPRNRRIVPWLRWGLSVGLASGLLLALGLWGGLLKPVPRVYAASFDLTGSCPGGVGDVPALITALNAANGNGEANTITLASGCVYTLTAVDNAADGANGLPSITSALTIIGNGATFVRDTASPGFRLLHVGATGALTLTQLTLRQGLADISTLWAGGQGGGLLSHGQLRLEGVTLISNTAIAEGGGLCQLADSQAVTLALYHSAILSNVAAYDGGGLYVENDYPLWLVISNTSLSYNQTVVNGFGGGLSLRGGMTGYLTDCRLEGNHTSRSGGGLYYTNYSPYPLLLYVERTVISSNQTGDGGGGIGSGSDGSAPLQLYLSQSTVSDNEALGDGGGIYAMGEIHIRDSAIVRNTARPSLEWFGYGNGGGLSGGWGAVLALTNTTVSGNRAAGNGGGIDNGGELYLLQVTIADNLADSDNDPNQMIAGDGGGLYQGANAVMTATVIASNTDHSSAGVYADCYQDIEALTFSGGYNLIGDETGCEGIFAATGDITHIAPGLAPLALNPPGATESHDLLPGSPALDQIPVAQCQVAADQRGVARPQPDDGQCDMGAVEHQAVLCTAVAGVIFVSDSPVTWGQAMHFTATATPGAATLPLTYTWDMGSGPALGGVTLSHTFATVGSHVVTLTVANPCGAATYTDTVRVDSRPLSYLYLPLVLRNYLVAPDLIVTGIVVASDQVTVTIQNIGNGPAESPFWVDFYVDPHPVPTAVNQVWYDGRSRTGVVWGIPPIVAPGEVLTLTLYDQYWSDYYSDPLTPVAAGTPLYAQVDSVNLNTNYGGVLESHEILGGAYNNIYHTVAAVAITGDTPPALRQQGPAQLSLPARPARPVPARSR